MNDFTWLAGSRRSVLVLFLVVLEGRRENDGPPPFFSLAEVVFAVAMEGIANCEFDYPTLRYSNFFFFYAAFCLGRSSSSSFSLIGWFGKLGMLVQKGRGDAVVERGVRRLFAMA